MEPELDIGQEILTPEVIQEMTGQDVVLIDTSQPDFEARLMEELAQAVDINGEPVEIGGAELQRLFIDARQSAAGTLNPDFTGGKVLERGIIVYNSSDLLMANSPQYWAQVSFLFSDSDPEYVSGTQIFDHPALLANISILTEVSHNMWFKRPEVMALRQADIEGTWLEDEANRNDPVFQRYMDETNGNEQIAVLMTLANKNITDQVTMEIQGDAEAVNFVRQWAEQNERPDVAAAADDFTAMRISRPMMDIMLADALKISRDRGVLPQYTDEEFRAMMNSFESERGNVGEQREDIVAGLGSVLSLQGAAPQSMEDTAMIEDTMRKAAQILNAHYSRNVDFAAGQELGPGVTSIHREIVEIYREGKLPELPEEFSDLMPQSPEEEQRIMDAMVAFGIAIERQTSQFNPPVLSQNAPQPWGIENPGQHWQFSSEAAPVPSEPEPVQSTINPANIPGTAP